MSHTCNGVPCVPIRTEEAKTLIEYQDGVRTWVKADGVKVAKLDVKVGDTVEWDKTRDPEAFRQLSSPSQNATGRGVVKKFGVTNSFYDGEWYYPLSCVTKVIRTPKFALGDQVRNVKTGAFAVITSTMTNSSTGEVIYYNEDQCRLLSLDDWEKWTPKFKVGDRVIQTEVGKEYIVHGYDTITGNVKLSGFGLSGESYLIPIPSVDMIPEAYSTTDGVRVSREANGRWRSVGTSDFSSPEAAITWARHLKGGAK